MVVCAIIRISGFYWKGLENDTWEFFWQHIEGSVAVMMASITAFRTLFIKQGNSADETTSRTPVESFLHKFLRRFRSLARAQPEEKSTSNGHRSILKLPKLPSPVFTGMRTFIRRNNRTDAGGDTFATLDSVFDGSEGDYHAALESQTHTHNGKTSSHGQPGSAI